MGALGLFPELRTRQLLATHVRAGTGLEILTGSYVSGIKPDLQSTYSLTSCDLVSHLSSAVERGSVNDAQTRRGVCVPVGSFGAVRIGRLRP